MHRSQFFNRNHRRLSKASLAGTVIAVLGGAAATHAASISFSTETQFSNDSVLIDPTGVGDYAVGFGQTASLTTVSSSTDAGVTFQPGPAGTAAGTYTTSTTNVTVTAYDPSTNGTAKIPTSGSYLGTATDPTLATAQAAQANGQPAGTGDANFATIVGHGSYYSGSTANTAANGGALLEITLNNLVVGDLYNMQVFFVDGRTASSGLTANIFNASDIATPTSGTGGASPDASVLIGEYANNTNNGTSIIGGYIDGSFVADSTGSESFYTNNTTAAGAYSGGNIQALVLQNAGPAAVPEPASLGIAAIAGVGLLRRRRSQPQT